MDIVIFGSGYIATVLGRNFLKAGHRILQVVGRNNNAASALAYDWNTESTTYKSIVNRQADIYVIAVSDNAIIDVVDNLRLPGKIVVHTSATVSKEVLKTVSEHYGVFYPLLPPGSKILEVNAIPFFVQGSDAEVTDKLVALARSVSTEKVITG